MFASVAMYETDLWSHCWEKHNIFVREQQKPPHLGCSKKMPSSESCMELWPCLLGDGIAWGNVAWPAVVRCTGLMTKHNLCTESKITNCGHSRRDAQVDGSSEGKCLMKQEVVPPAQRTDGKVATGQVESLDIRVSQEPTIKVVLPPKILGRCVWSFTNCMHSFCFGPNRSL